MVCIVDDDSVIVHFERDKYPTRENDKVVTLDVVVDGDFSVPFYVEVETNQGTALGMHLYKYMVHAHLLVTSFWPLHRNI